MTGTSSPRRGFASVLLPAIGWLLLVLACLLLPDLFNWLASCLEGKVPRRILYSVPGMLQLAGLAFLVVVSNRRPLRLLGVPIPNRLWMASERIGRQVLDWYLPAFAVLAALLMLASWAPHYLTWPWWSDTAYFALAAQSWEAGLKPYRDMYDFNFPGPLYVHWILGKAFGWGHTIPFSVYDLILLIGLNGTLVWWSQRRFHSIVPGLVGVIAILTHYLNVDYRLVAQRDWHAPLLVALGLLALEGTNSRGAILLSATAFALALSHRPHVVLFMPAVVSALDEHVDGEGEGGMSRRLRAAIVWSTWTLCGVLLLAAPLIWAGVTGDFLYWFQRAWYGGNYNRSRSEGLVFGVLDQLGHWRTALIAAGVLALALRPNSVSKTGRTWALALGFALLYKPLSPVPHDYLGHPLSLMRAISASVLTAWAIDPARWVASSRLLLAGAAFAFVAPETPIYCLPYASLTALTDLARHRWPALPPPGVWLTFARDRSRFLVTWTDYVEALEYVRSRTSPKDRVAAFFRSHPFPDVNATTGRLSPFPSPAGILWLRYVAPEREEEFANALEHPESVLVVWAPQLRPEPRLRLPRIEAAVRRAYHPEAHFGKIEVWRRNAESPRTGEARITARTGKSVPLQSPPKEER